MRETLLKILSILLPSAYLISNKTVLTLHNFKFPSIFLSWQLSIALVVIVVVYKQHVMALTLSDVKINLVGSLLLTISMYFGSRSLGVLPIPVFISGQILGTHVVESIAHLKFARGGLSVILQTFNSVFMVPLFILVLSDTDLKVLLCFLCHIMSSSIALTLNKTQSDIESTIKNAVVKIVLAISTLLLYGTLTGEVVQAGKYDFSKTHFKIYLCCSGVLSAATFVVHGWSYRSGKLQYRLVLQYVAVLVFGYWYDYNGDVTHDRDLIVSCYFVLLLYLDTHFAKRAHLRVEKVALNSEKNLNDV